MDEYDEELVKWFDDRLWPMIIREHWNANGMARQSDPYWEGYFAALDMVNRFIDEGVEDINNRVSDEEVDVDDD